MLPNISVQVHSPSSSILIRNSFEDITSSVDFVYNQKKDLSRTENFENEAVHEVLNTCINKLEFRLLVLNLLQELCSEKRIIDDEYEKTIRSVIKFTLENLCTIHYRFYKQHSSPIEELRSNLTHLLIFCTNGVQKCRNIAESLLQNGVVQLFLQLLQEVTSSVQKYKNKTFMRQNVEYLYSLLYSIINLFFQLLTQDNITKNLRSFNELYRQFISYMSGKLIDNVIKTLYTASLNIDRTLCMKRLKIIVTFIGLIIVRFKKLCRKENRLKECRIGQKKTSEIFTSNLPSHHDNLFGNVYKAFILAPAAAQENCFITSTFVILLRIVLENVDEELTSSVLRVLLYCGTCCCVPVQWFLPKLLKLLWHKDRKIRQLILTFLECRFYFDIGIFKGSDCNVCSISALNANQGDQWKCIEEYEIMLKSENEEIVRTVGSHLLKIFRNLDYSLQRYLLGDVLNSLFIFAKNAYIEDNRRYKDVMLVCLAIIGDMSINRLADGQLDTLLQTKDIRNLLFDSNFTELCCRILETRIVCKTSKLENGDSFTPVLVESCTSELNILLKCLSDYYSDIMRIIPFENDNSFVEGDDVKTEEKKTVDTQETCIVNFDVEEIKKIFLNLKSVVTTLERLIIRSTVMKSYFYTNTIKSKFQKLLFIILKILSKDNVSCNVEYSSHLNEVSVCGILLKLTQPLLIICLSLFDSTNVIENHVKELLNEALQVGKISLKQVCDSLLSMEQIENIHETHFENWNSTMTFVSILFESDDTYYSSNFNEEDDEIISWSNIDEAFSEISEEEGNHLVSLLESCSKSVILYPTVCTIAVDLINALRVDRCAEETLYCLHHLTTICKRNSGICSELIKQNVVTKLLDKLEESLEEELLTPEETDVQYAITQFLSVLFYQRVDRMELVRFFDFFKMKHAPFDHLLRVLVNVIDKSSNEILPTSFINFPVKSINTILEENNPAETLFLSMREIQKHGSIFSPWVVCGLALPLNKNLEWCIWLTGYSVSFWFKYELPLEMEPIKKNTENSESTQCHFVSYKNINGSNEGLIHITSLGYDTLVLETWINESTSCFIVRLVRPEGNTFEILSETSFQKPINDNLWHHVALNVKDTMKQQKIAFEISLIIDGFHEETRYLIFHGIFMRKVRPACIMIGDTRNELKSRYSFGNFMMFRTAILTKECCLLLCTYGPDLENVLVCSLNASKTNFVNFLHKTENGIPHNFSILNLVQQYENNLKQMQSNILVTFSPRKIEYYYNYSQNDMNNTVSVSMFPPATPALFKKTKLHFQSNQLVPHESKTLILSSMASYECKAFFVCLQELGGFAFVAFLFAKLVDSCQMESVQCDGLRFVLKSCFTDIRLYSQFISYNGYNVISRVITSSRFKVGRSAFLELTNIMCSKKAFFMNDSEEFELNDDVFICNPQIVTTLLLPHWHQWEKNDSQVMIILFRGLYLLISNKNIYKSTNVEQLTSVNIIDKTLDMCKEKFVFSEKNINVSSDLCSVILEFIKTMIGTPPSINHIKSIIDYLYIVHPTSLSFCSDSPKGFYFLFSSLSQYKSKKPSKTNSINENVNEEDEISRSTPTLTTVDGNELQDIPSSRSFAKSLVDLSIERKISNFLIDEVNILSKLEEDDFKKKKTSDSGIAGDSNTDERTLSDLFSCTSFPTLKNLNNDYNVTYYSSDINKFDNERQPSDSHKYASLNFSEPNTSFPNNVGSYFKDNCDQYIILTGLLNLIHDTILVLPDTMVTIVFKKIINYELFLILANHPNASVRNTVVKTILAWLTRCNEEETVKFVVHMKGFYHLANQLSMYSATENLVNSCISLMARCHWDALDQINEMEEVTFPLLHFSALPPLLAIFPGTVHNLNLALNVVRFFKLLINKVSQALKKLIENGLIESLVKTVLVLIHSDVRDENIQENRFLLNEIIDLFTLIMNTCIQTPGVLYLQVKKCLYLINLIYENIYC